MEDNQTVYVPVEASEKAKYFITNEPIDYFVGKTIPVKPIEMPSEEDIVSILDQELPIGADIGRQMKKKIASAITALMKGEK